jgi:tRNA(Arg) A34 adenosine deaminase TadA
MTTTIKTFMALPKYKKPDALNVAGYLVGDEFHYVESTNPALPAAVNILALKSSATVYTNLKHGHWTKTYKDVKTWPYPTEWPPTHEAFKQVTPRKLADAALPAASLTLPTLPAPLGGGLYLAAQGLKTDYADGTLAKGLARSLRYYMLAAYSLLDRCSLSAHTGLGNYVSALMVSDRGEILSAGINTGSYRHAEVNMLLGYFRHHGTSPKFPENAVVFSTLTPCEQCTKYLRDTKSTKSVIYFGQSDTGKMGKKGEKISSKIGEKTKEPRGAAVGTPSIVLTDPDENVTVIQDAAIIKSQMASGLASCMGPGSIAEQIGASEKAKELLSQASYGLVHKAEKTRGGSAEDQAKAAVIQYLQQWLEAVR